MPPTSQIDRPALTALLAEAFDASRLVTLEGPPGAGKTTLARRWLAEQARVPADRTYFCDLSRTRSAAELHERVCETLGVLADEPLDRTLPHLGPIAVVLDNFEQLVEPGASLLAGWVDAAPQALLLVTSREALRVSGERRIAVRGLPAAEAARLFVERCRAARADFELAQGDELIVEELVERLDRLPLAIELTAGLATLLTPRQMLARLASGNTLAASGARDAPARHGSMEAAFRSSWELLDEAARSVFAQLAVFGGSFELDAAEAVLRVPDAASEPVLAVVARLRDKSLLATAEDGRLTTYESLRPYAADALEALGELQETRERHADHYLGHGLSWRLGALGPGAGQAQQRLRREMDNFRAVHQWAAGRDWPRASMALMCMTEAILARGGYEAHVAALERAAEAVEAPLLQQQLWTDAGMLLFLAGLPSAATAALERGKPDSGAPPVMRARWSLAAGTAARMIGDLAAADALVEAAQGAVPAGQPGRGQVLTFAGLHWWQRGDLARAEEAFEEAVRVNSAVGDSRNQARTLAYFGLLRLEQERAEAATTMLDEAERLHEEQGGGVTVARVNLARALAAIRRDDLDAAQAQVATALSLAQRLGSSWVQSVAWSLRSVVAALDRRVDEARGALDRASPGVDASDDPFLAYCFHAAERIVAQAQVRETGRFDRAARPWLTVGPPDQIHGAHLPPRLIEGLLRRAAAARFGDQDATEVAEPQGEAETLLVDPDGAWFEVSGLQRMSLERRRSLRGIFRHLVKRRSDQPGAPSTKEDLRDAGWPGEKMLEESATRRVQTAVWTLRRMGLEGILQTVDRGYRLDPEVAVLRV